MTLEGRSFSAYPPFTRPDQCTSFFVAVEDSNLFRLLDITGLYDRKGAPVPRGMWLSKERTYLGGDNSAAQILGLNVPLERIGAIDLEFQPAGR